MPFAFTFIGLIFIVTGFQDTYREFGNQVQKDFSGPQSFIWWLVALGTIGAVGYTPSLEKPSRLFMLLVIVTLFIKNGGIFQQFTQAINAGSSAAVNPVGGPVAASSSGGGGSGTASGGGGGSDLSTVIQGAEIAATVFGF